MEGWIACTKKLNEWRMEVTCIHYTSLHTPFIGHHPSLDIAQLCFVVVKLQFLGKGRTTRPSLHF
jgi:hypothetical protein